MNIQQINILREAFNASQDPALDKSIIQGYIGQLVILLRAVETEPGFNVWTSQARTTIISAYILLHVHPGMKQEDRAFAVVGYNSFYATLDDVKRKLEKNEIDIHLYKDILLATVQIFLEMPEEKKAGVPDYKEMVLKLKEKCSDLKEWNDLPAVPAKEAPAKIETTETLTKNETTLLNLISHYLAELSSTGNRLDEDHKKATITRSHVTDFISSLTNGEEKVFHEKLFLSLELLIQTKTILKQSVSHIGVALKNSGLKTNGEDPLGLAIGIAMILQNELNSLKKVPKFQQLCILRWILGELCIARPMLIKNNRFVISQGDELKAGKGVEMYVYSSERVGYQTMMNFFHRTYNELAGSLGIPEAIFLVAETGSVRPWPAITTGAGASASKVISSKELSPFDYRYFETIFKSIDLQVSCADEDTVIASLPRSNSPLSDSIDRSFAFIIGENIQTINTLRVFHPGSQIALRNAIKLAALIRPLFDIIIGESAHLFRLVVARWVLRLLDYHMTISDDAFWSSPYLRTEAGAISVRDAFNEEYQFFRSFHDAVSLDFKLPVYTPHSLAPTKRKHSQLTISLDFVRTLFCEEEVDETIVILKAQNPTTKGTLFHTVAVAPDAKIICLQLLSGLIGLVNKGKDIDVLEILLTKNLHNNTIGHLLAARQDEPVIERYYDLLKLLITRGHYLEVSALLKIQDKEGTTFGHSLSYAPNNGTKFINYLVFLNQLPIKEQQEILTLKNAKHKTIWESMYVQYGFSALYQIKLLLATPGAGGLSYLLLLNTSFKSEFLKEDKYGAMRIQDRDGCTLLHCLASDKIHIKTSQEYIEMLHQLVKENPAKVVEILRIQNKSNETVGHCIVKHLDATTIKLYTDLLHLLIKNGQEEGVDAIINTVIAGEKNIKTLLSETRISEIQAAYLTLSEPLLRAIKSGATVAALNKILEDSKPGLEIKNKALLLAASLGSTKNSLWLISNGAEINAQDGQGNTALHLALQSGEIDTARALKDRAKELNLDKEIRNRDRRLPDFYIPSAEKSYFNKYKNSTASVSSGTITTTSTTTTTTTTSTTTSMSSAKAPAPKAAPAIRPIDKFHQEIKERQETIKALVESEGEVCRLLRRAQDLMKEINERIKQINALGLKFNSNNLIQTNKHITQLEKAAEPELRRLEEEKAKRAERAKEEKAKKKGVVATPAAAPAPAVPTASKDKKPPVVSAPSTKPVAYSAAFFPSGAAAGGAGAASVVPKQVETKLTTSIRFTILGIKSQLAELGSHTDMSSAIKSAGLLYEVSRLFELLNQLPGHVYLIDRVRNHTGHQYNDLLDFDYSPKYPCSPILVNLAEAYDVDYLCSYAAARQEGRARAFTKGPIDSYFDALGLAKDLEDFKDKRMASKVLTSIEFAVNTLKTFRNRLNPLINKTPEAVADGSPALFSACKMAIVILDNALLECSVHNRLQKDILSVTKYSSGDFNQLLCDLRELRNKARHFGETISKIAGHIVATHEISPSDIDKLEPHIEFFSKYLEGKKSGAKKSQSATSTASSSSSAEVSPDTEAKEYQVDEKGRRFFYIGSKRIDVFVPKEHGSDDATAGCGW